MNTEILNQLETLRPNDMFIVFTEDGKPMGVTNSKETIPTIIKDETCGDNVELTRIDFNKHADEYTLYADIGENGEAYEHEFKVKTIVDYRDTSTLISMIEWAEGLYTPFTFTEEDKQELIDNLNSL